MISKEADLLREQVRRSLRITQIKKNIGVLSNNITRLRGNESPEDLPNREREIAMQNKTIAELEAELHELELKQRSQRASIERLKGEGKKKYCGQKKPTGPAPAAEIYPEVNKTAPHANEEIDNSKPDCASGRDLREHCETSSPAGLEQKQIAELRAELYVLTKVIEKISAEMLKLGETDDSLKKITQAGGIPTPEIPFEAERAMSRPEYTAAKKRILNRLQLIPNSPRTVLAPVNKNADLTAKISENELREKLKKMTAERLRAAEESKSNIQRHKPAGKVSAGEVPGNAALHTNNTPPNGGILERPHPDPDTTQADASRTTKGKDHIPVAHGHELKDKIAETTEERTKALGKRINNDEVQIAPGNGSSAEAPLGGSKAVSHAGQIISAKRKPEEDPEVTPDNVKKQRYTPEPKEQEENLGKRKHIETAEPKVEKPEHISATKYAEKTLGDMETEKGTPHAKESSSKKRKAEEDLEAIADIQNQRYSPEPNAQGATPAKRRHIETEEREIESPECISTAEYDEQDEEDTRPQDAEQEKAEQDNPVDEDLPEVSQRSVEVNPVHETKVGPAGEFVPFSTVGMYVQDPFVDEVDYEID